MSTSTNTSVKVWVQWGISLAVAAAMFLIPESEIVTPQIKTFLAITLFAIMLIVFDLVDSFVTGIILFMGYSLSGIVEKAVVFSVWANDVAWMVLGALVFASILENSGIMRRCSLWIIKKTGGSYSKMLWSIYIAALAVSIITAVHAWAMFPPLVYGICSGLGYKVGSKEANGVTFAAMLGAIAPFSWYYNPLNAGLASTILGMYEEGLTITWWLYLKVGLPWVFFDLIWMVLLVKVFFKSQSTVNVEYFDNAYKELGAITKVEKKTAFLACIVTAYLILSGFIGWPTNYGFMLLPWIAFLPGMNIANVDVIKKTNFSIVFFVVGCIAIGTVGQNVGIGKLISTLTAPVLAGTSSLVCIFGVYIVATLANFLLTPFAVLTALGVPLVQIGLDLGVSPVATLFTIIMNNSNVFLPHENTAYLVFYAFGIIQMKDFIKYNSIRMGMHFVFMMAVVYPYWKIIGIL